MCIRDRLGLGDDQRPRQDPGGSGGGGRDRRLRARDVPPDGRARARVGVRAQPPPAPRDDLRQTGPVLRIGGQAAREERPERLGQQGQVGFVVHDPVQHADRGTVPVQRPAQRRERRGLAEREDVGRGRDLSRGGLLGRHEVGRADRGAGGGVRGEVGGQGDAEVDHTRPVGGQQHVGRLEVPVHDARGVDGLQCLGHSGHQPQHRGDGQGSAPGDGLRQGGAGHVQRGRPGGRAVGVGVDQLGGVGAADAPGRLHLPAEPPPEGRVVGQLRSDHLDRHRPAALRVGQVDPAHAAGAEPGGEAVSGHHGRVVRPQRLEHLGGMVHRPVSPSSPVP